MKISKRKIKQIIKEEIELAKESLVSEQSFNFRGKKYYMPWEEEASFDPTKSVFRAMADTAIDPAGALAADMLGVEYSPTEPLAVAARYWGKAYKKRVMEAWRDANTRIVGSPPDSEYDVNAEFYQEVFEDEPRMISRYDKILDSNQLGTDSIFDAIDMFYGTNSIGPKKKEIESRSDAFDFNGDIHPSFAGSLNWGPTLGSRDSNLPPQYYWLAGKFKEYGITPGTIDYLLAEIDPIARERREAEEQVRKKPDEDVTTPASQDIEIEDDDAEITLEGSGLVKSSLKLLRIVENEENVIDGIKAAGSFTGAVSYLADRALKGAVKELENQAGEEWTSPLSGQYKIAEIEADKIKRAMSQSPSVPTWDVYYAFRAEGDLQRAAEDFLSQAQLTGWSTLGAGAIVGTLLTADRRDSGQYCVYSFKTTDPRWVESVSGAGQVMTFQFMN